MEADLVEQEFYRSTSIKLVRNVDYSFTNLINNMHIHRVVSPWYGKLLRILYAKTHNFVTFSGVAHPP